MVVFPVGIVIANTHSRSTGILSRTKEPGKEPQVLILQAPGEVPGVLEALQEESERDWYPEKPEKYHLVNLVLFYPWCDLITP